MSQRWVVWDSEHLVAHGNDRGLVVVFKGDPAVISNHEIYHKAFGRVLNLGPGVTAPTVRAVAFLRGRGIKMQYVNPNPHYMTYLQLPEPPIARYFETGAQELPIMPTAHHISLYPNQTRWLDGSHIVHSLIRPNAVQVNTPMQQMVQARDPREVLPAVEPVPGQQYTFQFNSTATNFTTIKYTSTDVGKAMDAYLVRFESGYTESYVQVAPEDKSNQLNEIIDCLSARLAPRTPPDQYPRLSPMSYNDYHVKLRDPSWRRLMVKGGATDLVEYITGTRSKQMMRMLMPVLFRHRSYMTSGSTYVMGANGGGGGQVQFASNAISTGYTSGDYLQTQYFEMREFLRTLSVDHRIRFVKLYLHNRSLPGNNAYIGLNHGHRETSWDNLREFFTCGDHTKILNKVEESLSDYEARIGQPIPIGFAQHNPPALNPFDAMNDTGSQLLNWRKRELNKRQLKYFPKGIVVRKWQSIDELHDDISKQATKLEGLGQLVHMPWVPEIAPAHGTRCGKVRFMMPRTNMALVRWGKAQGHCVGSMYNKSMQDGQCQIVGVFVDGQIKYCIRLTSTRKRTEQSNPETWAESAKLGKPADYEREWHLTEFRGKGNCWPDAQDAAEAISALKAIGVDCDHWSQSGNGYGTNKDGNWDYGFNELMKHQREVVTPPVVVKNFTSRKATESDLDSTQEAQAEV